jgi:hypothetical protein
LGNRIRNLILGLSKLATTFRLTRATLMTTYTSNLTSLTSTASFVHKFTVSSIIMHPIRPLSHPYRLQKSNSPRTASIPAFQGLRDSHSMGSLCRSLRRASLAFCTTVGRRVSGYLDCRIKNRCPGSLCRTLLYPRRPGIDESYMGSGLRTHGEGLVRLPLRAHKMYLQRCRLSCISQG